MSEPIILGRYILIARVPVPMEDTIAWGSWMQTADRHVGRTQIQDVWVSTVFLGLDHNFFDEGPPLLFETMAFLPPIERTILGRRMTVRDTLEIQRRYSTWDEAEDGHIEVCNEVVQHNKDIENLVAAAIERAKV